jgi:hypothetical protein
VHRAENVVDEFGVTAAAPAHFVEGKQIATQAIDDFLSLGEKLLACFFACVLAPTAAWTFSHQCAR